MEKMRLRRRAGGVFGRNEGKEASSVGPGVRRRTRHGLRVPSSRALARVEEEEGSAGRERGRSLRSASGIASDRLAELRNKNEAQPRGRFLEAKKEEEQVLAQA